MISTGIEYLDNLTSGLQLGDNVVFQVTDAVPVSVFIRSFFDDKKDFQDGVVLVSFNYSPHTICKKYKYLFSQYKIVLIDAFTHGKGNSDPVFIDFYNDAHDYPDSEFICIENPRDPKNFMATMNKVERENRDGSVYFFDSLTGMKELWKDERTALDYFTYTCPKLYDLNTIAFWVYERQAHTSEFHTGVFHTTQIVMDIRSAQQDFFDLRIKKLEGRAPINDEEAHYFRVIDRKIEFNNRRMNEFFKIGEKVKYQRKLFKITQAELAVSLGLTPGAVSQIENSITVPSLHTLMQLSHIFKKNLDYFAGITSSDAEQKGYGVYAKTALPENTVSSTVIERLVDPGEGGLSAYQVTFKAGTVIEEPLFLHKGQEFVTVLSGSCTAAISGREENLSQGMSLYITDSFVTKWVVPEDTPCICLFFLM